MLETTKTGCFFLSSFSPSTSHVTCRCDYRRGSKLYSPRFNRSGITASVTVRRLSYGLGWVLLKPLLKPLKILGKVRLPRTSAESSDVGAIVSTLVDEIDRTNTNACLSRDLTDDHAYLLYLSVVRRAPSRTTAEVGSTVIVVFRTKTSRNGRVHSEHAKIHAIHTMDCTKLISAIQERRSLWDSRHSEYHNRSVSRKLWSEVASLLDTTSTNAKGKWQRLKDTHRREIRKNNSDSKWKYFNEMKFLVNMYLARLALRNGSKSAQENTTKDTVVTDRSTVVTDRSTVVTDRSTVVIDPSTVVEDQNSEIYEEEFEQLTSSSQKRPEPARDPFADIVQLGGANVDQTQKSSARNNRVIEEDEDYCFLMSILPHLRAIPQNKKLQTRIRLQQVLIDEREALEPSFHSSTLLPSSLNNGVRKDMYNTCYTERANGMYNVYKNREMSEI